MKTCLSILFLICSIQAHSSVFKIATGEFIPYVGQHIPNNGISTMIVKAVFKEMKQEYSLEFVPWKRVLLGMENSNYSGSYPWNINKERLNKYYFSHSINEYRSFVFFKKGNGFDTKKSLTGKKICIPDGWDQAIYKKIILELKMQIISPVNVESCFNMLALQRVDVIFMNELVGKALVDKVFGEKSPVVGVEKKYLPIRNNFHFIVSKKYPNGDVFIEKFNKALKKIKTNGVYDSILSTKSSYELYNRLGSL